MMRVLMFAAFLAAQGSASPPLDVSSIAVSQPTLRRVSWSPDGRNIHVQTAEVGIAQHDYIVTVVDGVVSQAFGEPEWAAGYWAMKSDLAAPGLPSLQIEVQQDNRRTRPTPTMPAWSSDGTRLAFLQKTGKKKYRLMIATVGRATI
jgi:Tol biopolymer transport system component